MSDGPLPIYDAIPALLDALRHHGRAVLQAPPGAGKTTVVPLEMLRAGLIEGRIVMLEPRRLAARAAAERMAQTLNESPGQTVGYRMRGATKVSRDTRIEVVTEGILTRMIQTDPELTSVGAVIFDEFHERSLNADLGLALCLDVAGALREDLVLVAMSATLDADPIAELIEAPIITSSGRSFPVTQHNLERPVPKTTRFAEAMAGLVEEAVSATQGGVLAFLPGEGEIRRVAGLLEPRLPRDVRIMPLYGALPFDAQRAAIASVASGRKLVLATSIAETSLTIDDIRVVVDGGLARRARFDPASGMSRLVTEKASRAEANQRAGRAGRVAPGECFQLWTKAEAGARPLFPPAEIEAADLTGLALELALWGAEPQDLAFLTPPSARGLGDARALLRLLGALDASDRITAHGKEVAALPLHPRLAHMVIRAGRDATPVAAFLAERDPFPRGTGSDLAHRLEVLRDPRRDGEARARGVHMGNLTRIRAEAKRLSHKTAPGDSPEISSAGAAALAYPDRVGMRRAGEAPRFLLSGGKGAVLAQDDALSGARFVVATELDGDRREASIRLAIALDEAELRALFGAQIAWHELCEWDKRTGRVRARRQEKFGAITLEDRIWRDVPEAALTEAMLDGVRELGLVWSDAAARFAARVSLARKAGADLPDLSEPVLLETLESWLKPYLRGVLTAQDWRRFDIADALRAQLDWSQMQDLDAKVPAQFTTPLGRKIAIDYTGEHPEIVLRLQEMFGQTQHPTVGGTPLRVTLLSPAGRPVQTTLDLPGFWRSSYADVRKDMRGRYPKHPWPEDPTVADPTLRTKRKS